MFLRVIIVLSSSLAVLAGGGAPLAARDSASAPGLIAFASQFHAADIYSMNANGTGVKQIAGSAAPSRWPVPSPDGSKVAFARKVSGAWSILVLTLATGSIENVSDEANLPRGFDGYPDWSPDGTKLAFNGQAEPGGRLKIIVVDLATHAFRVVTPTMNDTARPRWSPDGTRIAFAGNAGYVGLDLYVVNADGTGLTRLTTAPGWEHEPAWSPDGKQLAYTSYPDNRADVYVMNADGTGAHDITNTQKASETQPTWSGAGIAFRSDRTGVDGVFVMAPNGTAVHRVSAPTTYDEDPAWSRDGKTLLFTSGRASTSAITLATLTGGESRTLTRGKWFDTDPSWSPDGSRLAFTRSPTRGRSDVYVMRSNGRGAHNLTRGRGLNWGPTWSPDGSRIAFVRFESFGAQLWTMNSDGTEQRALTGLGRWNVGPRWSPDGKRIVFSAERNGSVNLYTADVRTGRERRLTRGRNNDVSPSWSPDGRKIAFVAQQLDANTTEIWVVGADGSGRHPVTNNTDNDADPVWSPDGKTILYAKDEFFGHDSDLWTVPSAGGPEIRVIARDWPQLAPSWQAT